eukprot:Nitzschia sp. Nitz4//scaffold81_size91200//38323//39810//NITZ4_004986-RA/size91200-processed-gene-0.50-mRNA-1//1//CDS//3329558710//7882//frame0
MVVRVRQTTGEVHKVLIPPGAQDTTTVSEFLAPFVDNISQPSVKMGNLAVDHTASDSVASLGLSHGTLLTIHTAASKSQASRDTSTRIQNRHSLPKWNPFPDLVKDYQLALARTKNKRVASRGMSYEQMASIREQLHVVEPQRKGSLQHVYMCSVAAERFQRGCIKSIKGSADKPKVLGRVGLLFGTIHKERLGERKNHRIAKTSLSGTTSTSDSEDFGMVAKVQAIWEPPGQEQDQNSKSGEGLYDVSKASSLLEKENARILTLAERLGLVPIGWIFSYSSQARKTSSSSSDATAPIRGVDIQVGGSLQAMNMKARGPSDGTKFSMVAMSADTGETEAFQLSDVAVQMVHQGVLSEGTTKTPGMSVTQPTIHTRYPVLVGGKETQELDPLLCIVNIAILSHTGSFSGTLATSSTKKSGDLTTKKKKAMLGVLQDDRQLLKELCDLNIIIYLDRFLSDEEMIALCGCVNRWSRGQKQTTQLPVALKRRLRGIIES